MLRAPLRVSCSKMRADIPVDVARRIVAILSSQAAIGPIVEIAKAIRTTDTSRAGAVEAGLQTHCRPRIK